MRKTALITGGTKGIGKAVIKRFAKDDFDIITCSRSLTDLKNLKEDIESGYGTSVDIFKVDMSIKKEVEEFGDKVAANFSQIDVLVNNAGIFLPGQIHKEEDGVLEQTMALNLFGVYHLTRKLIPNMMALKKGHIFNLCSTASFVPYINGGSYCISKFALLGFSKVLREEMKEHKIRVTAIMPGATMSASWEGVDLPEERFMKASDVAEAMYSAYSMSDRTVIEEIVLRPQLGDI